MSEMKSPSQVDRGTPAPELSDPRTGGSFSIRLTKEERDLLDTAAKLRGWTTAKLIKTAALERAAHITNTGTVNRVDFSGIARTIADLLLAPKASVLQPYHDEVMWESAKVVDDTPSDEEVRVGVENQTAFVMLSPGLKPSFAKDLMDAARYGGAEFAGMIAAACESIAQRGRPLALPDPIDPSKLGAVEEVEQ